MYTTFEVIDGRVESNKYNRKELVSAYQKGPLKSKVLVFVKGGYVPTDYTSWLGKVLVVCDAINEVPTELLLEKRNVLLELESIGGKSSESVGILNRST